MRKIFQAALFAFAVGIGTAQAADISVKIAPPRAEVEHRGKAPSKNHVWIGGYQRWDGNRYTWEKGRWEVPPQPHQHWVAPRWSHRNGEYVFAEGHWK